MRSPPVFVVNLAAEPARLARIEANLCEVGVSAYHRFEAVSGRALSDKVLRESVDRDYFMNWYGRLPSVGEVGCTLSHLGVYEQLLATEAPFALVLEDDALLGRALAPLMGKPALCHWLASNRPRVLLLSAADRYLQRGGFEINAEHRARRVRNAWLAHGYLVNRAAATMLLDRQRPIRFLVDDWLVLDMVWGLEVYCVQPPCISLHDTAVVSSLDADRQGLRARAQVQSGERRLRRACRRVADALFYKPFFGIGKGG